MPPKVSTVTPSYNQGQFIERTIRSVLSQDVPGGLDYFVADGGSRDETVEILKKYQPRLTWVSESDRGQADAVNKGFSRAESEIIGWLNSDDIYYPGAIATVCEYFDAHPEVDVVYGDANHIDENDGVIERYPTEPWDLERLYETCYLCQPAVFFRRRTIERFGALDVRCDWAMDYEYWIRLARRGAKFAWVHRVLAGSRLHEQTKTLGSRVRCHAEVNDIMKLHLRRVPDRWLFNYAHAVVETKGIERSRRFRFAVAVSLVSISAALRWNRRVSRGMARTVWEWVGGASRALLEKAT